MVIYYNDKPVYVVSKGEVSQYDEDAYVVSAQSQNILKGLDALRENETSALVIYAGTEQDAIRVLSAALTRITAAGGIVVKNNDALLVIKRHGKWDLPKGKLEKDESIEEGAKREIEEECGIEVKIKKPLKQTYHIYEHYGKSILKETYWFVAELINDENIAPQKEEGITEVRWIPKKDIDEVYNNTYSNIRDVLNAYFKDDSGN